ncbi:hypothetical protein [Sphingosinicella sp. BN140058]|uniref:hypothetical protein n=1 Tax=Sphingosinicella sp. BN140058 TaxID=1892855 RepID=UPI001010E911|nr:hypothetical protein [Sphingosinicella sp. BN140058]QAY80442.1 hypothetical protein ETR14_27775 [Sphingosinicella sp. BN140058]
MSAILSGEGDQFAVAISYDAFAPNAEAAAETALAAIAGRSGARVTVRAADGSIALDADISALPRDKSDDERPDSELTLHSSLVAALEWIDAVPADVVAALPPMPGFDRDAVDQLVRATDPRRQRSGRGLGALLFR